MLAFTSVREDVPVEEVTRDLERLSHEAQAADQPALAAAVLKAQEALSKAADDPTDVASARGELSEALVDFVATVDRAGRASTPVSAPVPLAPMAPITLVERLRARRRDARGLPRGSARGDRTARRRACAELQRRPGDLEPADDAAPRLPHPQGQLADGRAEGLRRSRLGVRAGLQHPARRAARRRAAADRVHRLGARPTSATGSRTSPRTATASATSARSSSPPTALAGASRPAEAAPTSPCRSACRPTCRAAPTSTCARPSRAGRDRPRPIEIDELVLGRRRRAGSRTSPRTASPSATSARCKLAADRARRAASPPARTAPTSPCRWACRPTCRARADLELCAAPRRRRAEAPSPPPTTCRSSSISPTSIASSSPARRRRPPASPAPTLADASAMFDPLRRRARATRADDARQRAVRCAVDVRAWSTSTSARPTDAPGLIESLAPSDAGPRRRRRLPTCARPARPARRAPTAARADFEPLGLVDLEVGRDAEVAGRAGERRARQGRRPAAHRHPALQHLPERGRRAVAPADDRGRRVGDGAAPAGRRGADRARPFARRQLGDGRLHRPVAPGALARARARPHRRSSATAPTRKRACSSTPPRRSAACCTSSPPASCSEPVARAAGPPGRARAELGAAPRGGDRRLRARRRRRRASRRPSRRSRSSRC